MRVFDRFFRAPQQAQAGSGLGLAIVAAVVRQHGGTIHLHRASGGQDCRWKYACRWCRQAKQAAV